MEQVAQQYKELIFPCGTASAPSAVISFEKAMLDASADCIKVISVDGMLLTMNRAGCLALGVAEESGFGMPWLPLLPEGVHEAGTEAIATAREGQGARFPGQSVHAGKTTYWDNLLTPIFDDVGEVRVILCVSRDVTANALLKRELEDSLKREKLLAQEMRHRIKNVFAVVSSLLSLADREAAATATSEAAAIGILREKLASFARASDLVFAPNEIGTADEDRVDLTLIVKSVLEPYAGRYQCDGQPCILPRQQSTAVVLFLHELATNCSKHGAFSIIAGTVRVSWEARDDEVVLTWAESGGPPIKEAPRKQGFGSKLIDRIAQSTGGKVSKTWSPAGLKASLHLPNA